MDTPLSTWETTLKATRTKLQFINLITRALLGHCTSIKCQNTLIATGQDSITIQTEHGIEILRRDMETTHEQADDIIPQHIHIAKQSGKTQNFKVKCDDTDNSVLLLYPYVTQKWTGDILLESLEEGWLLTFIKKDGQERYIHYILFTSNACFNGTVPKMFGIGKVSALNISWKNPLNHLGNVDALSKIIGEETNTFAARCYGVKNSVDMTEIRFMCSKKFILWLL